MNKTKEKILDTALSLFMTHGYSVGINEIIQKSGTSKGALYHYFKSKENLLDESMEQFFSIAYCELNTPESSNQTFRVKIENIIFKAFSPFKEFSKKFPSAKNLNYLKIISEYPNHETLRQKNAEYFKRFTSMLKKIIDEAFNFPWDLDELKLWEMEKGYLNPHDLDVELAYDEENKEMLEEEKQKAIKEENDSIVNKKKEIERLTKEFEDIKTKPNGMETIEWVKKRKKIKNEIDLLKKQI